MLPAVGPAELGESGLEQLCESAPTRAVIIPLEGAEGADVRVMRGVVGAVTDITDPELLRVEGMPWMMLLLLSRPGDVQMYVGGSIVCVPMVWGCE